MDAMNRIANWTVEAKNDSLRYYYVPPIISEIDNFNKSLIVGRKGVGKTAASLYLSARRDENKISRSLSLSSFPFDALLSLSDHSLPRNQMYESLWKFVILNLTKDVIKQRNNGDGYSFSDFKEAISVYFNHEFHIELFGANVSITSTVGTDRWRSEIEKLENYIKENSNGVQCYLIFDELDDSFKKDSDKDYFLLIEGLISACQYFRRSDEIFPIVFLRDDIYHCLDQNHMAKWLDIKANFEWTYDDIKAMIAYRLCKSLDDKKDCASLDFESSFYQVFAKGNVLLGSHNYDKFQFIHDRTLGLPRDVIYFISRCAVCATKENVDKIYSKLMTDCAEKKYSEFFFIELVSGLIPYIPFARELIKAISGLSQRKKSFTFAEFENLLNQRFQVEMEKHHLTPDSILKTLYGRDVIGNVKTNSSRVFSYTHSNNIDRDGSITLHRGLYKAFDI